MPVIQHPYRPNWLLRNRHFHTIYAASIRPSNQLNYKRLECTLPDGDFVEYDITEGNFNEWVLLIHGLEGNSRKGYMNVLSKYYFDKGKGIISLNSRSCGDKPNLKYKAYNAGVSQDLRDFLKYIIPNQQIKHLDIISICLGANMMLKWTGEEGEMAPQEVKTVTAISSPCDLEACTIKLAKPSSKIYNNYLLKPLQIKALNKLKQFPNEATFSIEAMKNVPNLIIYDDLYTAPASGFKNAVDYYTKSSSKQFLPNITIPTLIIQSTDDPFLAIEAIPYHEAENNPNIYLVVTNYGGHVGFLGKNHKPIYLDLIDEFMASKKISI